MMTSKSSLLVIGIALIGMSASMISAVAQANTAPAGYFEVMMRAGTGSAAATTAVSFPLQGTATAAGQMVGVITGVTSNTISNSSAGWTAGQLASTTAPYLIEVTSGAATGRTFLISTGLTPTLNTSSTLTLDISETTDLTTLHITPGTDTYCILPADTLSTVFGAGNLTGVAADGTSAVLGGTGASNADTVAIFNGAAWITYYYFYSTTPGASHWARPFSSQDAGPTVIRPDTGVLYSRLAPTALTVTMLGSAPTVPRQTLISNQSLSFLSTFFPTNVSLVSSNIQNIPGWLSGSSVNASDTIALNNAANGVWTTYFYNGAHWAIPFSSSSQDAVNIPAGSTVIVTKHTPTTGTALYSESLPYSL
jgi:hypothetical protein